VFKPPEGPWEIIPFALCSEKDRFIDFLERPELVRFLRQFKGNLKVMANLRDVLTPPYQISLFDDDEVIELIAWKVAVRQLAIRLALRKFGTDVLSSGSGQGGSGGGGAARRAQEQQQQTKNKPQKTAPAASQTQTVPTSRTTKSWFAITVVEEVDGAEKVVDNLTLQCELPVLGKIGGVTSKRSPVVRFDNLDPGGAGSVLATSHDDVVWEVVADID
jgi:hypothetical protein